MYKILFFLLLASSQMHSQTTFSKDWLGQYAGQLILEFTDGKKDSLQLELDFLPTDNPLIWKQTFRFFSAKYGNSEKDYLLKFDEAYTDNRHYFLDEQNSITIDEVLLNNTFYAHYEVLKSYFHVVLRKESDHLYYEIACSRDKGGRFSQSERDEEGKVYEVTSSLTYTVQHARLYKVVKSE